MHARLARHRSVLRTLARGSRGQSLVEFSIALPVLLLLLLVAIDFGRVYLGWINAQNMARIAANFAANNAQKMDSGDTTTRQRYFDLIEADAQATNCQLWNPTTKALLADPPLPTFIDIDGNGVVTDIGDQVSITLDCRFGVITPGISSVVGSTVTVTAGSIFPIKTGMSDTGTSGGGGGGGGGTAPTAAFSATPQNVPLGSPIVFTDESGGLPTAWQWDFGDPSSTTDGSSAQDASYTYTQPGIYTVTLTVFNAAGQSTTTRQVGVSVPAGANFTVSPGTSGTSPFTVTFTNTSTGGPFTSTLWEFGDGQTSTADSPSHTYVASGGATFTVRLTVTNAAGTSFREETITVGAQLCNVPTLSGLRRNQVQSAWNARGFTTTVQDMPGAPNGNYRVNFQDLTALTDVPCNSTIRVNGS